MSWIFGLTTNSNLIDDLYHKLKQSIPANHKAIRTTIHLIFLDDDINVYYSEEQKFIVRGFGFKERDNQYHQMELADWANFCNHVFKKDIAGQYLRIVWNDEHISFSNDFFGLNTIYFFEGKDVIYFSTRLDYLCQFIDTPRLNTNAFGGHWLLFNQLTHESLIENVVKLKPNSETRIINNRLLNSTKKDSSNNIFNEEPFLVKLQRFSQVISNRNYSVTLGLSGGLDSRVILEYLLNSNINFKLHSFGKKDDADVIISSQISRFFNLEHFVLDHNIQPDLSQLTEFITLNEVVDTISTYLLTSGIHSDYFKNKILIDGAGGELFRRQFLNRLIIFGKKSYRNRDPVALMKHFTHYRADIFNDEINLEMQKGAINQISKALEIIKIIDLENFADTVTALSRFPNYYGPEQNRLNTHIRNYMPFVNKELYSDLFQIPLRKRRNNRMFYDFLRNSKNKLSSFELVKDGVTYPFGKSSQLIYLITRFKKKLLKIKRNSLTDDFYLNNKNMVLDILESDIVRTNELFDQRKILAIIENAYKGKHHNFNQLDWLFSFELFRRALKLNR